MHLFHPGDLIGAVCAALLTLSAVFIGRDLGARAVTPRWAMLVPVGLLALMSGGIVYWLAISWS